MAQSYDGCNEWMFWSPWNTISFYIDNIPIIPIIYTIYCTLSSINSKFSIRFKIWNCPFIDITTNAMNNSSNWFQQIPEIIWNRFKSKQNILTCLSNYGLFSDFVVKKYVNSSSEARAILFVFSFSFLITYLFIVVINFKFLFNFFIILR